MRLSITHILEATLELARNVGKCGYFDFPGKTLLNALASPPGY
jgi:hypothetical protein